MNQIFEIVFTYGYFIGIVTFLFYLLKAAIDFWFVTEIEKKLMTDYQKLKGFISKLIITIIPNVLLTFLLTFVSDNEFLTRQEDVNENILLVIFLSLIFLLNICFHLIVVLIEKGLNLKSDYILFIDNEEWRIKRLTRNNLLLLVNEKNEYLLIDEWKEKKIKKIIKKNNYTYKIYSNKISLRKAVGTSLAILALSILTFIFHHDSIFGSIFLFTGSLAILSTMIMLGNRGEYKREHASSPVQRMAVE